MILITLFAFAFLNATDSNHYKFDGFVYYNFRPVNAAPVTIEYYMSHDPQHPITVLTNSDGYYYVEIPEAGQVMTGNPKLTVTHRDHTQTVVISRWDINTQSVHRENFYFGDLIITPKDPFKPIID